MSCNERKDICLEVGYPSIHQLVLNHGYRSLNPNVDMKVHDYILGENVRIMNRLLSTIFVSVFSISLLATCGSIVR